MSKTRRTKRDKIVANKRRNTFDLDFNFPKVSQEKIQEKAQKSKVLNTNVKDYSYILTESKYTLLVSAIILAINVLLFITLKQNYINLFGLKF